MTLARNRSKIVIMRLMVVFPLFALFAAHGENLTTLDGRTFTNVVFVTNYPTLVIIKHDGGESGIKNLNLPTEFCAKHGVKIPDDKNVISIADPDWEHYRLTNDVDSFLVLSDSKLSVESSTNEFVGNDFRSWTIKVSSMGFELRAFEELQDSSSHTNMFQDEQSISFGYYDNSSASTVFNKVLQWGKIASQNNVESFQKPIESVPQNLEYKYEFYWNKDNAVAGLTGSRTETYVPFDQSGKISKNISSWPQYVSKFTFDQKSMVHFLELMQSLPELRQELADKIYKQKKQQDMFH